MMYSLYAPVSDRSNPATVIWGYTPSHKTGKQIAQLLNAEFRDNRYFSSGRAVNVSSEKLPYEYLPIYLELGDKKYYYGHFRAQAAGVIADTLSHRLSGRVDRSHIDKHLGRRV